MKKILIPTLVMLLLVATVFPALAGGSKRTDITVTKNANLVYVLAGYITAVDDINHTVTVEVAVGNTLVEKYVKINLDPLVHTDKVEILIDKVDGEDTRLLLAGGTVITWDQLYDRFKAAEKAGTQLTASSRGYLKVVDGVPVAWAATRITLGALLTSK